MAIKQVFKCTMPGMNYVTKHGRNINFGELQRFETDHPAEIEELQREVAAKHPHIFIDPNETSIDTTLQDKIREAQEKATLEVLEAHNLDQAKQKQGVAQVGSQTSQNAGSTAQVGTIGMSAAQLLNVGNSATLGALGVNSNSGTNGAPTK